MKMHFTDRSVLAGTEIRQSDGMMVADVRIARTGIQLYRGSEVDPKNEHGMRDRAVVRVYRPGSEVFSEDTMKSAAHRPVTNDHPPEMVTADNWKKYAVGQTADEIKGEGIYIRVPLLVSDAAAIKDIQSGKREVSSGYWSELDFTDGETPDGEKYDAVQRNIRINHVAIVQHGRAGSKVRIGDDAAGWGPEPLNDSGEPKGEPTMANRTVTVDGITIEVTDQGAQVIEKLQRQIADAAASASATATSHTAALAAKDKELATKDAEIADLKTKVVDAAALDKLVVERVGLVTRALKVVKDVKTEGLSAADIRKAVVVAKLGDAAIKDKSDAYIEARFDSLVEAAGAGKDDFRDASRSGIDTVEKKDEKVVSAYDKMVEDLKNPKLASAAA